MRLVILVATLAIPFTLKAGPAEDIRYCAKITKDNVRLACYDLLGKEFLDVTSPHPQPVKPEEPVAPVPIPDLVDKPVKNIDAETEFGKPKEQEIVDSIKSRIDGQFKGWVKGNIIKLSNGQKWKVVSQTKGYTKLTDPEVEISSGIFGSFNMKVTGFSAMAKVRRIK